VEGDTDEWKFYNIKKLIKKRVRRYGRDKPIIEYLVRWQGYDPEFDEWYGEDLLDKIKKLITTFKT